MIQRPFGIANIHCVQRREASCRRQHQTRPRTDMTVRSLYIQVYPWQATNLSDNRDAVAIALNRMYETYFKLPLALVDSERHTFAATPMPRRCESTLSTRRCCSILRKLCVDEFEASRQMRGGNILLKDAVPRKRTANATTVEMEAIVLKGSHSLWQDDRLTCGGDWYLNGIFDDCAFCINKGVQ